MPSLTDCYGLICVPEDLRLYLETESLDSGLSSSLVVRVSPNAL